MKRCVTGMLKKNTKEPFCWDKLAKHNSSKPHIDPALGKYKSDEFMRLVRTWINSLKNKAVLKTDLREEAYGEDEILFSLPVENSTVVAIDIDAETVREATVKQKTRALLHHYLASDARKLPFKNNVFDVILSTSTLDHFTSEPDLIQSLMELKRVIKPQGSLIMTLNNKCNFIFYIFLKLEKFFGLTRYPVNSFTPQQLRKICHSIDLNIQNEDMIIHIVSPINTILLLLRKFLNNEIADFIAKNCILFASWLSKKQTKLFTSWFIALQCSKDF